MKRVVVLGSTGSIGVSTLRIIEECRGRFQVVALSTHTKTDLLREQCRVHRPQCVAVSDTHTAASCGSFLGRGVGLYAGETGLLEMLERVRADIVVMAISGRAALEPLLAVLDRGIDVALANKETLVMAGEIVMRRARRSGARILPVDSEQSAIWQCLDGKDRTLVRRIVLTASGGPLRGMSSRSMQRVPLERVLRHPRWNMGHKITVDSATLMNKGLEFIETMVLFGMPAGKIDVVIHPESIIHSMVEFCDGIIMAQLSVPDMRIPLYYALAYPARFRTSMPGVDFVKTGTMHFDRPDVKRFPCLELAMQAAQGGGTMPAVANAANEVAVAAYLKSQVCFGDIPRIIGRVMRAHASVRGPRLEDILEADQEARARAMELVVRLAKNKGRVC